MATSTESNPPAKDNPQVKSGPVKSSPPSGSGTSKGSSLSSNAKGLSALTEMNLEKSIIRRGLATQQEIDYCKTQRAKLEAEKNGSLGLLDVMIAAKAMTVSQAKRVLQEVVGE